MPSNWAWWAGIVGDETYDLAVECRSREAALAEALRNAAPDDVIQIVEARMSSAMKYEGSDFVPFTHTRNHEIIGKRGPAMLAAAVETDHAGSDGGRRIIATER